MVKGDLGEFSVSVDGHVVIKKGWLLFPKQKAIIEAVREALA